MQRLRSLVVVAALLAGALSLLQAAAIAKPGKEHKEGRGSSAAVTEDTDTNDGGTPNNKVDDGDNRHPSGKDRSVERGGSGNQGRAKSDPDDDGRGPDRSNGGADRPGGPGGVDLADQDGNNGCGNDDDFEDDNEGWCGRKPKPSAESATIAGDDSDRHVRRSGVASAPTPAQVGEPPVAGCTDTADHRCGEDDAIAGGTGSCEAGYGDRCSAATQCPQAMVGTAGDGSDDACHDVATDVAGVSVSRSAASTPKRDVPDGEVLGVYGEAVAPDTLAGASGGGILAATGIPATALALFALLLLGGGGILVRRRRTARD